MYPLSRTTGGKFTLPSTVIEAMDFTQAAPSLSQAQRLKKLSQEGGCTLEAMQDTIIKLLEQWQRKRQRDQER